MAPAESGPTRSDGMDQHHRRAHAHPGHFRFEFALESAGEMGDIGGGAAHVEADDMAEAGLHGGLGHADHAAGRAGQYGVLAPEQAGGREAPGRGHEHQPRAGAGGLQFAFDLRHVAPEDRRQVGVDDGGVAAPDQLYERADLVGGRHLREAGCAGQIRGLLLVRGITVGVHEDDRDGLEAFFAGLCQFGAQRVRVEPFLDRAIGKDPPGNLHDLAVEFLRLDDFPGEDVRTRLIADAQRIAKAARGDQKRTLALALQKGVGGDRRAHAHVADDACRYRLGSVQAKMVANALNGRVRIGGRVFRQELAGVQRAIGRPGHDVGECAATIDPEIPGAHGVSLRMPAAFHLLFIDKLSIFCR